MSFGTAALLRTPAFVKRTMLNARQIPSAYILQLLFFFAETSSELMIAYSLYFKNKKENDMSELFYTDLYRKEGRELQRIL
jgi:hypothetical protein